MFCKKCGAQIDDNAVVCPNCGTATDNYAPQNRPTATQDGKSAGFAVLCFFFPVVGLILYLVWKDSLPLRAKSCGKGAIIGVIVYVVFVIIYAIIAVAILSNAGALSAIPAMIS